MARTKKEETKPEEIEEAIVETTPESIEVTKTPEPENIDTNSTLDVDDIPEFADVKLKLYSNYKELYIDNKGGVYTSKDQSSKDSTLYKNPYHKQ